MNVLLQADPLPLREDPVGTLRVGKSRVLLELVIHAFQQGATPEKIVQSYDTLELADVYAVIAHCLRHPEAVENYLKRCEEEAAAVQQKLGSHAISWTEVRARLLARKTGEEKNGATARQ
jgi:uncharacterized protein (DUF433 family)